MSGRGTRKRASGAPMGCQRDKRKRAWSSNQDDMARSGWTECDQGATLASSDNGVQMREDQGAPGAGGREGKPNELANRPSTERKGIEGSLTDKPGPEAPQASDGFRRVMDRSGGVVDCTPRAISLIVSPQEVTITGLGDGQ